MVILRWKVNREETQQIQHPLLPLFNIYCPIKPEETHPGMQARERYMITKREQHLSLHSIYMYLQYAYYPVPESI